MKSFAQESRLRQSGTAFEEAALDSAVRLEKVKIALFHLQTSYGYKSKEADDLREALRLSELQNVVQRQGFEKQIADLKKKPVKQWWKGFRVGFGTGLTIGGIAGSSI